MGDPYQAKLKCKYEGEKSEQEHQQLHTVEKDFTELVQPNNQTAK